MIALSIKSHHVRDILAGAKTQEYRSWPTKVRGDVLVVTCKEPPCPDVPGGHALCIVSIVDCKPYEHGGYAWTLANVRRIRPFPVKGQLRFYDVPVPEEVLASSTPITTVPALAETADPPSQPRQV